MVLVPINTQYGRKCSNVHTVSSNNNGFTLPDTNLHSLPLNAYLRDAGWKDCTQVVFD